MQEKRNIRLLITLIVSCVALAILIYAGNREAFSTIDKQMFRVEDQTRINKVVIKPVAGGAVELRFDGAKWLVNNSYQADRQMIQILFATLLQTEPRREVAQTLQDSVSHHIKTTGYEIQLFEGDQLVKQFRVGGNASKTETYFQLPDGVPYIVQVPGYRLYIASVFELSPLEWRDKWLFNFNWQNFRALTASFPTKPQNDFTIAMQQTYFGIEGLPAADTTRLNNYLDAVSLVQASRFVQPSEFKYLDSLVQAGPEFTIRVSDIANRNYSLEVYPVTEKNTVRLARLNGETVLLLNRADREAIARTRSYFGN
ncbi:MAG: DUF4340 domain-containing protein [Cyclobacteriaceae bacterium]|nr:DUF4340 domain-containing protein [Cyclobacteriaceae bacterium]